MELKIALLFCLTIIASAFRLKLAPKLKLCGLNMARRPSSPSPTKLQPTFEVGVDIPEEIAVQKAIYDMILVERFNAPEQTSSGLFLPKIEGKDRKHLAKVLSVPVGYGLESEQGRVQSLDEIAPIKVGDTVYVKVL